LLTLFSIPTGIVFKIAEDNSFSRGALGYLPFITVGLYAIALVVLLIKRSNKKWMEIAPIIFLCIALLSQVIFPFVYGSDFSKVFCPTLGIALFIYYVFEILQQTKKDSLTGLLNRNAFETDISNNTEDITALISLDMNGLKVLNDTQGHHAGDEALLTLALCINRALKSRQYAYRIGGDEFAIICRKASEEDVSALVSRIKSNISETKYYCSIGFCYCEDEARDIEDMLQKSDMMMYDDKKCYYAENNLKSR
jgi:diguanylate cyclase (GGDEF)-like protein